MHTLYMPYNMLFNILYTPLHPFIPLYTPSSPLAPLGKSWSREEDHLALIVELSGEFPDSLLRAGNNSSRYVYSV